MKSRILILAGAAALALGRLAAADSMTPMNEGWYLEPALLGVDPDSAQSNNSAVGYRMSIGKTINENWDLAAAYDHTQHDATPGNLKLGYISLNALRVFHRDERFSPYYVLGVGNLNSSYSGGASNSGFGGKAGVGGMLNINPGPDSRFKVIGDAGLRIEDAVAGSRMIDPYVALGVRFVLGEHAHAAPPPPAMAPPPPPAPPADSDHVGVPDTADQCPIYR
ncbi:MAG: hypothetical protein RL684_1579 [Pseudomonadota bacterium]